MNSWNRKNVRLTCAVCNLNVNTELKEREKVKLIIFNKPKIPFVAI